MSGTGFPGTDGEMKRLAEPILSGILRGITEGDYSLYSADFDGSMKAALPEIKFTEIRNQVDGQFGLPVSAEYIGFLVKGAMRVTLWKGRFTKTPDDILIQLVCSESGGRTFVSGLWLA